jgi:two-component system cell cycle sensor histidine kinase/response regulator CckA
MLRLDLARDLPAMEADPSQLQQVVMNLVINAAEAIGDRAGEVRVVTRLRHIREPLARPVPGGGPDLPPGDYVSLEVYDNGCGMDRATLAKIFDPFFTTKFAGRGLGLAAVLGIVNGHRGTLCVDSTPGRGTAFRLLFPAARGRALRVSQRRPAVRRGRGTVLVVDDEESVRNAARNALSHFGYTVLLASGGLEAVEALRDGGPTIDLVVLDLTMPGMGGEEALQRIREVRPDVPVLLSSGFNYVEVVRRFTGQGITGFVQKPYTAAQLAAAVGNAMEP